MEESSGDGDNVCPLCAKEMDLTNKQLKPCQCGYEICVWCWNHIMEMAEKDRRCPACREPYNKEKIVGMSNPKWDPAKIEDVDLSEVDTMLQPLQADSDELQV